MFDKVKNSSPAAIWKTELVSSTVRFLKLFLKAKREIENQRTVSSDQHLHGPRLPDGLDVVPELPEEQVVSLLVRVKLLDPGDGVDQGQVQGGRGLLQQDLQALDHIYKDLLP